ncbi:Uncharacterized protein GBIM_08192 [Gryllus bimaculatus]|nr:Uncharacterized protein GBIM_08192 [Gryllus bimaculatus]
MGKRGCESAQREDGVLGQGDQVGESVKEAARAGGRRVSDPGGAAGSATADADAFAGPPAFLITALSKDRVPCFLRTPTKGIEQRPRPRPPPPQPAAVAPQSLRSRCKEETQGQGRGEEADGRVANPRGGRQAGSQPGSQPARQSDVGTERHGTARRGATKPASTLPEASRQPLRESFARELSVNAPRAAQLAAYSPRGAATEAAAAAAPARRSKDQQSTAGTTPSPTPGRSMRLSSTSRGGGARPPPAWLLLALLALCGAAGLARAADAADGAAASDETPSAEADDFSSTGEGAGGVSLEDCDPDMIGFELVTGFVYSAPGDQLDSLPGTLMLTDCLEACQANDTCQSVNYETGLCVLFSSHADSYPGALTRSQFPVFTIYAQKSCLGVKPCERAWCFDRVQGYRLKDYSKKSINTGARQECLELCLGERDFPCRSANYNNVTGDCELSDMDRLTVAGSGAFEAAPEYDYLENNCVEEPVKLCEFKKLPGRILKTVDSVYQDVGSADDCRELCLTSPYRCHSYDYNDTGDLVCRLSHHSRATLVDIQEPYLDVPEASTYELSSCYNVTIDCQSGGMVARIKTSKLFNGKIYAKGSPNSCVNDVRSSLEFDLRMGYDDVECNVRQQGLGRYLNDVVIQHHDTIVTSSDLGLAVTCQYDLTNKSVSNEVDLGVHGDVRPALSEEVIVDSPNVAMKITDRYGSDLLPSAEVGDPLALRFEILDKNSPYEIFVRELVAMDGVDSSEIMLLSHFDAFKFPSSEVVQFRALVTPCMPSCEPVQCDQEDSTGEFRSVTSFGKRRRRRATSAASSSPRDDMLLVQSIKITDKFGFERPGARTANATHDNSAVFVATELPGGAAAAGFCVNAAGIIVAGTVFLALQLAVIAAWTFVWQRRRQLMKHHNDAMSVSVSVPSALNVARADSLCKLFHTQSFYSPN